MPEPQTITLPEAFVRKICVGYACQNHKAKLFEFRDWQRAEITVEWRGDGIWAVCSNPWRLNKNLEIDNEPLPSSRTDDYIEQHSWPTIQEAIDAAKKYINIWEGRINEGF